MVLYEVQHLASDVWIAPHIAVLNLPVSNFERLCVLGENDTDGNFGCLAQIRAVERDCCDRSAAHSFLGLFS